MKTRTSFPHVPKTSFSPCTRSSKQELAQLLERFQGSKRLLKLQWIHFIDSGGGSLSSMRSSQHSLETPQPPSLSAFIDIIFIMKLSEGFDEDPVVNIIIKMGIGIVNLIIMQLVMNRF